MQREKESGVRPVNPVAGMGAALLRIGVYSPHYDFIGA
jgi:hypothetical protein